MTYIQSMVLFFCFPKVCSMGSVLLWDALT